MCGCVHMRIYVLVSERVSGSVYAVFNDNSTIFVVMLVHVYVYGCANVGVGVCV